MIPSLKFRENIFESIHKASRNILEVVIDSNNAGNMCHYKWLINVCSGQLSNQHWYKNLKFQKSKVLYHNYSRLGTPNVQLSCALNFKKAHFKCTTNEKRKLSEHDEKNFKENFCCDISNFSLGTIFLSIGLDLP